MQRMVTVTANIAGADLGTAAADVQTRRRGIGQAAGQGQRRVRGQVVPLEQLLTALRARAAAGGGSSIFLLLAANFQSWQLAVVTVSTAAGGDRRRRRSCSG